VEKNLNEAEQDIQSQRLEPVIPTLSGI